MKKIAYRGSKDNLKQFLLLLKDECQFVQEGDEDLLIIEIDSVETLFRLPKKFSVPAFFFITTKDRRVVESIRQYYISGIFTPPLKKEDVAKKLSVALASASKGKSSGELDTLKAKVLAKAESIPALPALAKELLRLSRSDNSQIKDFIVKIKKDQGISSKIIKLVNSPFYGLRQEISSIDRATVLLGINTVKNLALAVSTEGYYAKHFNLYKSSGQRVWEHSVAVAMLSESLAEMLGEDPDSLYLAGLMHDIGKSILVDFLVQEVDTTEDELAQLGIDHSTVGGTILKKWAVADSIATAVMNHHHKAEDIYSKIVYYANKIEQNRKDREEIIGEIAQDFSKSYADVNNAVAEILNTKADEMNADTQ
ncbi:MAG: HDOD domain-containing protein [Deferribacterales bacterium]